MKIIKFAKFVNNHSAICEFCSKPLLAREIVQNLRHQFPIGIMYICSCGKSRIWTNSLRAPERFIQWVEGKINDNYGYYQGYCNDKYCGFCFNYIQCLKNGISVSGHNRGFDRYGCEHCSNQHIAMDLFEENKEGDTGFLETYYKTNLSLVKSLVATEEVA